MYGWLYFWIFGGGAAAMVIAAHLFICLLGWLARQDVTHRN